MEIRPNKLKRKLLKGELGFAVTGFYSTDEIDAFGAALTAAGVDALWFDGEHGPTTHNELGDLTRACDLWGVTSIMRLGENNQNGVYRAFDRGAQAVVIPHVESRAEAENIVKGGKFPPLGNRGVYIGRQGYAVDDYFERVNAETMLIAMIETVAAMRNLDEILDVDEIDLFFVGAWDLAGDMGFLQDRDNPRVKEQVFEIIEKTRERGRVVGAFASKQDARQYVGAGAQFIMTVARQIVAAGADDFVQFVTKP